MAKPRQRPIPVTRREREQLDSAKARYEQTTGDTGDWGKFLGTVIFLGLAGLGVYKLAKITIRSPESVSVGCPQCGNEFLMVLPEDVSRIIPVNCPHCQEELVVDLESSSEDVV